MRSDLVDVDMCRHAETDKAILVSETGEKKDAVWLAKSQVEIENDGHANFITVAMPQWLAREKGFI